MGFKKSKCLGVSSVFQLRCPAVQWHKGLNSLHPADWLLKWFGCIPLAATFFSFLLSLFSCLWIPNKSIWVPLTILGVVMNISDLKDLIFPKRKVIWHLSNNDYIQPCSPSIQISNCRCSISQYSTSEVVRMAIH